MSSNLLVQYKSWGGKPAKPRAPKYIKQIKNHKPDIVGIHEMSGEWYSTINNNLPDSSVIIIQKENNPDNKGFPEIYNYLTQQFTDVKYIAEDKYCGNTDSLR